MPGLKGSQLLLAGLTGSALDLALAEAGLEPGHAAASVEDLLLARVERVASRANVGADHAVRRGGPRHECVAAPAGHGGDLVVRVNLRLHLCWLLASCGRRVVMLALRAPLRAWT